MADEEGHVEAATEEDLLWEEAPVDSPAVEKLSLQLKGAEEVGGGVG